MKACKRCAVLLFLCAVLLSLGICFLYNAASPRYLTVNENTIVFFLNFTSPTELNATTVDRGWAQVNISITGGSLDTFRLNWNGTNYTVYDDSLVLALNFNNNSAIGENSSKAVDVSRYGNNGTLYNTTWYPAGRFGGAVNVSRNGRVEVPYHSSLNPAPNMTVSLWFNGTRIKFKQISAGGYHSCGVLVNGSALCWGNGGYGRLGYGGISNQNIPVYVNGSYVFTSVSAGYFHSCGVLTNGSGMCWGWGADGRLGYGGTSNQYNPVYVNGSYIFTSVSAGNAHSLWCSCEWKRPVLG